MKTHIHILSPSGAINPALIDGAKLRLEEMGYQVSVAPHAKGVCGRFAGTEEERLNDLNAALADPAVDIILCARGGYGLQQIVERIKLKVERLKVKGNAKSPIVVGFSDITELHQWCGLHGLQSLHGLMCKHIAELPADSEPVRLWHQALRGEALEYTLPTHPLNRAGEVAGRLIGGNLSVLYGLQATPYSLHALMDMHPNEKFILFIEDIGERHYHIDRMMQNLRMSGVMARISGLIVGQFSDVEEDGLMGCSVYETVCRAAAEYDYPVLVDFPAGHVERNLPLWMNSECAMRVNNKESKVISKL